MVPTFKKRKSGKSRHEKNFGWTLLIAHAVIRPWDYGGLAGLLHERQFSAAVGSNICKKKWVKRQPLPHAMFIRYGRWILPCFYLLSLFLLYFLQHGNSSQELEFIFWFSRLCSLISRLSLLWWISFTQGITQLV